MSFKRAINVCTCDSTRVASFNIQGEMKRTGEPNAIKGWYSFIEVFHRESDQQANTAQTDAEDKGIRSFLNPQTDAHC